MSTFDELNKVIPYVKTGDIHSQVLEVYDDVRIKQPGRHAFETRPQGGDFVVEVNCDNAGWAWKKFTHEDIFYDLDTKVAADENYMQTIFAPALARVVVEGSDPLDALSTGAVLDGLKVYSMLRASQVLAVAEHRRYARFEARGGGRFLPARFALGIIFKHWTGADAAAMQKTGSNGLQILEKRFGTPPLLKDLV